MILYMMMKARCLRSSKANNAKSVVTKQQSNVQINSENNQSKAKSIKRILFSSDSSSGEDEESPSKKKRSNNNKAVVKTKSMNEKKDPVSDDEEIDNNDKLKKRQDVWVEVYVESKESWISINIMDGIVDCIVDIYKKASKPVLYVIAYDSEGLIKDVTRCYCPHWLSVTRKQRIDEKWWTETLIY